MPQTKRSGVSAQLCNASLLLYMSWLLLPAVQNALHAVTGVAAVGLFGLGVLLDGQTFQRRPWAFLLRVLCAATLPLALFYFLERGGGNLWGYFVQQGMFWFPPLWCAYARQRDDALLYRAVGPLWIALLAITTLTTIGWLIQGLTRGDHVYAYARSLGSGEPGRAAYLKELMGRNIGGYDFIYASVLCLPLTFYAATQAQGWKRFGWILAYVLQLAMIGLSQYTYALLFAAGLTALELLALLLRLLFRRLGTGPSLAVAGALLAGLWLARMPLLGWAAGLTDQLGFVNASYSLHQLLQMLAGGTVDSGSRLDAYAVALQGFAASPLVGSLPGGAKSLGMHSDLFDLLSGLGLLGTALFALGAWAVGRGALRGVRACPARAQLALQGLAFLGLMALGTVFYSREIPLALCMGATLLLRRSTAAG